MSEIEKELIHEIEQLILHAEEDSLDYSVEQWLKTLPEPLRSEALEYAAYWDTLKIKKKSLVDAIGQFSWGHSKSGYIFWCSFALALSEAERDQQN